MLEMSDDNNIPALTLINEALGKDFTNLIAKCNGYKEFLLKKKYVITEKIKLHVDQENPDGIYKILNRVQAERLEIISLRKEVNDVKLKYYRFRRDIGNFRSVFEKLILNLKYNCNKLVYYACIQSVIRKSKEIKKKSKGRYENEAIIAYKILCKLSLTMNTSPCTHLVSYINTVVYFWHCVLEEYYLKDFENVLKQINWPFTTIDCTNAKLNNHKRNFQKFANKLIEVQLPENECFNFNTSSTSELMDQFSHISLPITMLIVPFRKRFVYHFTGKKLTNLPDKPEWYFSRVLRWIREYRSFMTEWLGPVYVQNGKSLIDSQHEFAIGLMQSIVIKLESDLSNFQLEDSIFSHIIDETLLFEHELRNVYGYPNDYPSVTDVLAQADIFFKWINMERKYGINKLNTILSPEEPKWDILVKDKQYIITHSADSFLTLLNTMTDRYNVLRQPRHKIQFLKLQIDLLDEFKKTIVQLSIVNKQPSVNLQEMLCTLHFVRYTLLNWGTNVNFLSLLSYKCELQYKYKSPTILLDTAETVFDETIKSYDSEIIIFSNYLCDDAVNKIKRLGKQYKKDNWHLKNQLTNTSKYTITDSGWLMYEQFTKSLYTLNTNLPISVFNKIWPIITDKFAKYIYTDILLANTFNCGGAQHLYLDIKCKIISTISTYTTNPNMYIERLLEACKVLCFEVNFKPVKLTQHEVSEILHCRMEYVNSLELS